MSEHTPTVTRSAARKWLGPILLLSLIANVFLGAHFAVGLVRHFEHGVPIGGTMMGSPHGAVMKSLSVEERKILRQTMQPHREVLGGHFREMRAARLALSDTVGADPYDPEAARQAFEKLRNAMTAMAASSQGLLVDAFADLSPETRARIALALKQFRHRPSGSSSDNERREIGEGHRGRD